ncbi:hypothetical protein FACS1894193_10390 [Bacilli bacterium]|nr:hypothetical protein FACS1894192_08990 [Bacilli bacterium]GHU43475.1 hypothetical protein FACS1894193_10390 [Bacilli bacterium]GHU46344.1 hypothetical protein FACS1894194_3880 [Bacilli bacterium]
MSKKKFLILGLLLLWLPVSYVHADETDYESQGNVGFTGVWETPDVELPDTGVDPPKPAMLPRTGDSATSSMLTSSFGVVLLLLIAVYKKLKREGVMREE